MAQTEVHVITDNMNLLPHIRREVLNCGGRIVGEHARAQDALTSIREYPDGLVLMDLQDKGRIDDLGELGWKVPQAQIIVLTAVKSVEWILECQRKGAAQVVLLPLNSEDFAAALHRVTYQQQHVQGKGMVVAVSGATHGVGGTFIACNLANEMGELLGQNIFLADFNINMGAVTTYLDITPQYTLGDLLEYDGQLDRRIVESAITQVGPYLNVLAAPRDWLGKNVEITRADELITILQGIERVTVLDVPCTYDDIFFAALMRSDHLVLLAEQDVPAVRALGQIISKLYAEGITPEQIIVVINRYGAGDPKIRSDDIEPVIQHPINHRIINDYKAARSAIDRGVLLKVSAADSDLRTDVIKLAQTICILSGQAEEMAAVPPPRRQRGALSRLARSIGLTRTS